MATTQAQLTELMERYGMSTARADEYLDLVQGMLDGKRELACKLGGKRELACKQVPVHST